MKFYYLIKREEYNKLIQSCESQKIIEKNDDETEKIQIMKNREIPNELKVHLISHKNKINKEDSKINENYQNENNNSNRKASPGLENEIHKENSGKENKIQDQESFSKNEIPKQEHNLEKINRSEGDLKTESEIDHSMVINTLPEKYRTIGASLLNYLLNHIKISKKGDVLHKNIDFSLRIDLLLRSLLVKNAKIQPNVERFLDIIPIDASYITNKKLLKGGGKLTRSKKEKWILF